MKKGYIKILLVLLFYFTGVAQADMLAGKIALEAMKGTDEIRVSEGRFIVFEPVQGTKTGLVFYPGAKVDPLAYAPLALRLTKKRIMTIIVPMPNNLAIFGMNRADIVLTTYPDIENWFMAGHSHGGSVAGNYLFNNADRFRGFILLASFSGRDLSDKCLPVLSIAASEDGIITLDAVRNKTHLLPKTVEQVIIEGGNHAQFGDYGWQNGDMEAKISMEVQLNWTVEEMVKFIGNNE